MPPTTPSSRDGLVARVWLAAYAVVSALALAVGALLSPLLLRRGYGVGLRERLGSVPPSLAALHNRPVWIHAASVGEARAAHPLVARLRRDYPDVQTVVSTTTVTGRAVAAAEIAPDAVTLLPLDAFGILHRTLAGVRPRCLVLIETELWPGLLDATARLDIPVVVLSGRLSPGAARRYRWAAPLFRAVLAPVAAFGMQSDADAERIIALGAHPERVRVTGSLKHAAVIDVHAPAPMRGLAQRPLLIAASTQPGEEAFVLEACRALWAEWSALVLLVAPRRPERFDEVADLLAESGLSYERRTQTDGSIAPATRVVLLDTVGELPRFYPAAAAVFVGGTIVPLGGHNVLEPAGYGRPVTFGPHTANVAAAARALEQGGGGRMVETPAQLADIWREALAHPDEAVSMGERARAVAAAGSDALERNWALLAPFVSVPADV